MHLFDDSAAFYLPPYTHLQEVQVWALTGRTSPCLHLQRQTNCLLVTVETIPDNTMGSAHWIGLLFSCCHVNIQCMNHSLYSWTCTVYTDFDIGSLSAHGYKWSGWHSAKPSSCWGPKKTHNKAICLNIKCQPDGWVREKEGSSSTVSLYYRLLFFPPVAQCPWYRCWDFMCG